MSGPVIGPNGNIYVTDNKGTLLGLKSGIVQPTPPPVPTSAVLPPTQIPPPTFTPAANIVIGQTPTGGSPTATPTSTPAGSNSGSQTSVGAGNTTTQIGGSGGTGTGAATPQPGQSKPVQGNRFRAVVVPGALSAGNLSQLTIRTDPKAEISYTVVVSYISATAKSLPKVSIAATSPSSADATGVTPVGASAGATSASGVRAAGTASGTGRSPATADSPLAVSGPRGAAHRSVVLGPATTDSPLSVRAALPQALPAAVRQLAAAAPACAIALTVSDRGTYHVIRHADARGLDRACIRVASIPKGVVGFTYTVTVRIRSGTTLYNPSTLSFNVVKTLRIVSKLTRSLLFPNDMQAVTVATDRGAQLVYRITYAPGAPATTLKGAVDAKGAASARFKASFTPARADGLVTATVTISGALGLVHGTSVLRFTVQRHDVILTLKKLKLQLKTSVLKAGAKQSIDVVAARGAYLSYTVVYGPPGRSSIRYAVVADGSGYATLRFPITYKPTKGAKVPAVVTVTAKQGRAQLSQSVRFSVQG